ncbi:MAG TPA: GAF domain-containing protein [Candidatus Acidoferrales bacterium]|nr:GAF domain-containing protein [Candidatus Acidoferrales bacterium]
MATLGEERRNRRGPAARGWLSLLLAGACALSLVGLYLFDALTPPNETVGVLAIFPVLAAAWLLSGWLTIAVAALAVTLQVILGTTHELTWVTVSADSAAVVLIAVVGRQASLTAAAVRASREHELELLLETARGLNVTTELEAALDRVVESALTHVGRGAETPARAAFFQLDGDGLVVITERDQLGSRLAGARYPLGDALQRVLESGRAASLQPQQLASELGHAYAAARVRAVAFAPVVVEGAAFGLVATGTRDRGAFSAAELRLLEGIADLAGLAIANAHKLERERARVRIFQTLHDVAVAVGTAPGPEEVAEVVVEKGRSLVAADVALIAWPEGAAGMLRVVADSPGTSAIGFKPKVGVVGRAFSAKRGVVDSDPSRWDRSDLAIQPGGRSLLAVPLLAKDRALGVLAAMSAERDFSGEDLQAVALLASQVGPLLEDARLRSDLAASERRLRSLYSALGCGVLIQGPSGALEEANWAAEKILGLPARELTRWPPFGEGWSLTTPDGAEVPVRLRPPECVIKYRRPVRALVARAAGPAGEPRWLRIDSSGIEEDGNLLRVVTTFFEVTEPIRD